MPSGMCRAADSYPGGGWPTGRKEGQLEQLAYGLWFALGLLLLVKGSGWFVDASVWIAQAFRVSELAVGATLVSVGTTLPEVMVSATAAMHGHGEMAFGNAGAPSSAMPAWWPGCTRWSSPRQWTGRH